MTNLIDDETASRYWAERDTAPEAERESRNAALMDWAKAKKADQFRAEQEQAERAYMDLEGWWKDTGAGHVFENDEDRLEVANRRFIAHQFQQTPDQQGRYYPTYRDEYLQKTFGKSGLSETDTFNLIRDSLTARKATEDAMREIPGALAKGMFQSVAAGKPIEDSDGWFLLQDWKERHADKLNALPEGWESAMIDRATKLLVRSDNMMRDLAPESKRAFDTLLAFSRPEDAEGLPPADRADVENLAKEFAKLDQQKRQDIYSTLYYAAEAGGAGMGKGFFEKVGEGIARGGVNIFNDAEMTAQDRQARQSIAYFQSLLDQPEQQPDRMQTAESIQMQRDLAQQGVEENTQRLAELKVLREIRDIAQGVVDPIKTEMDGVMGQIVQGAYDIAPSLPYMGMAAVPYVGFPATMGALANSNYLRMLDEYPDIDADAALGISMTVAAPMAFMERYFQALPLMGKSPLFNALMRKITSPRTPLAVRLGIGYTANVGWQTVQEYVQEAMPIRADQIAAAIRDDMPEFDAEKAFKDYREQAPAIFYSMLWGGLIAGGFMGFNELKRNGIYERRLEELEIYGITGEAAQDIAAEQDPDAATAKFRTAWDKRTPEEIQAGIRKRAAQLDAARSQQDNPELPVRRIEQNADGSLTHIIERPDGTVLYRTKDSDAADMAFVNISRMVERGQITGTTTGIVESLQFIDQVNQAAARGEDVQQLVIDGAPRTLLDEYEATPTQENLDNLFATVRAFGQEINEPAELAQYPVLASNRGALAEGIYKSVIRIQDGATGVEVMRDFSQDNLKRALAENRITMEWVREQLNQVIPLIESDRLEGRRLRTETDTDVIESFSDVAVAYMTGRIKDEQIPGGLRGFLRRIAIVVRDIFRRAYRLNRAIAEGKVDASFESLLAESVGLDQQAIVDTTRDRIGNEVLADTSANYSIGKKQDADYLAAVDRGDMETAQRMADEAAKPPTHTFIDASKTQSDKIRWTDSANSQIEFYKSQIAKLPSVEEATREYEALVKAWSDAGLGQSVEDTIKGIIELKLQPPPSSLDEYLQTRIYLERKNAEAEIKKSQETLSRAPKGKTETEFKTGKPTVVKAYHSTPFGRLIEFSDEMLGRFTGAPSATKAHFFAGSPSVSETYFADDAWLLNHKGFFGLSAEQKKQLIESAREELPNGLDSTPDEIADLAMSLFDIDTYDTSPYENVRHDVYIRLNNPLVYDFKGAGYRDVSYNDLLVQAAEGGHDGVIMANTTDPGPASTLGSFPEPTNIIAVLRGHSSQIKSADPVTYDASGNVIPLSQRFDATTANINYSIVRSVDHFKNDTRFDKLVKDGRVFTGVDVNDFIDQHILLHSPDNAFAGTIQLTDGGEIKGKGGVYYPALYADDNYFWASTEAMVMRTANHLNEIGAKNGGRILMGLVSAPVEKLFSSTSMSTGVVKFLNALTNDPRAGLSKDDLNAMLVAASKVEVVVQTKTKTTKKTFSTKLKASDSYAKNFAKIDTLLAPDGSIFQVRKAFVESLADQISKHLNATPATAEYVAGILADAENKHAKNAIKRGKLSKASFLQGLGNMLTEPFLRDFQEHGNGKIYAIVEVQGKVKGIATTEHESYPATIVPVNKKSKVKLHVLKEAVDWQDVVGKETGQYATPQERLNLLPTSGMSSTNLKVLGVKAGSSTAPINYSILARYEGMPSVAVEGGRPYSPIVRDLLKRRAAGEDIPREVIEQAINENFPAQLVEVPRSVAELPDRATIDDAIDKGQRDKRIDVLTIEAGEKVAIRQDVPAMTRKGVGVVTVKSKAGNSYEAAVRITEPEFVLNEKKSLRIAMGEAKGPHIVINGKWAADQSMPDYLDTWTQVGYNPDRHSFYYDRATMQQVVGGSEAYQIGNTVFVKDAQYGDGQISDISYSISTQSEIDRVNRALSVVTRGPEARLAVYERARARFGQLLESNKEALDAIKSATETDTAPALEQVESERASNLADLAAEENAEVAKALQDNADTFMPRIEAAATPAQRRRVERDANDRAKILEQGIRDKYKERKKAIDAEAKTRSQQIEQAAATRDSASRARVGEKVRRTKLLQSIGELDAILSVLPPEVRGRVGGFAVLANIGTGDKALSDFFVKRIEMIDRQLEKVLAREYRSAIEKLLKKALPKKSKAGVLTSTLGPEAAAFVKKAYAASLLDQDAAAERLQEIQGRLEEETDQKKVQELAEEWAVVNLFGAIDSSHSTKLASALDVLKSTIKAGRQKWKMQQDARREEIKKMVQTGLDTLGEFTSEQANLKTKQERQGVLRNLKDSFNRSLAPYQLLETIFGADHPITVHFSRKMREATNDKNLRDIEARRKFEDAARVALGFQSGERGMKVRWAIDKALLGLLEDKKGVKAFSGRRVKAVRIPVEIAEKVVRGEINLKSAQNMALDEFEEGIVTMTGSQIPRLTDAHIEAIRQELASYNERLAEADSERFAEDPNATPARRPKYISIDLVVKEGVLGERTMNAWEAMQYLATWNQPDGRAHMERNGFTEESVKQMQQLASSPFAKALYNEILKFYADNYSDHNRVFVNLYGVDMPKNINHSPLRFETQEKEQGGMRLPGERTGSGGMMPGHIKSRTKHQAELAQANMAEVFWNHVENGNYWIAWAESVRDMRAVLLNPKLLQSVTAVYGEDAATQIRDMVTLFTDGGVQMKNRAYERIYNNIVSAVSTASLGFRLSSIVNQNDAGLRFMLKLSPKQQSRALVSLMQGNFVEKYRKVLESDTVQIRLEKGVSPLVRMMVENSNLPVNTQLPELVKKFLPEKLAQSATGGMQNFMLAVHMLREQGFMPMQLTDTALTSFSAAVVYENAYLEAKDAGMPDAAAEQAALDAMDDAVFRTAQPVDMAQRSMTENMALTWQRGLMQFMSDQRLKFSMWGSALRGLAKGEGDRTQHLQTLVVLGFMGIVSETFRAWYRDFFTDDDDEEIYKPSNWIRAFLVGPLTGFWWYGTILDTMLRSFLGERTFGMAGQLDSFLKDIERISRNPDPLYDWSDESRSLGAWKAAARVAGGLYAPAQVISLPLNIVEPVLGAAENIENED